MCLCATPTERGESEGPSVKRGQTATLTGLEVTRWTRAPTSAPRRLQGLDADLCDGYRRGRPPAGGQHAKSTAVSHANGKGAHRCCGLVVMTGPSLSTGAQGADSTPVLWRASSETSIR